MFNKKVLFMFSSLVLVAFCFEVHSKAQSGNGTVILEAEADAYIRTDLNIRRNDNYGCQEFMAVGTSRGGGNIPFGGPDAMRALLRFDLSGITSVTSAILELTIHGFDGGLASSVYTIDIHRIVDSGPLTPWIEGNGTERSPQPPGCEFVNDAFGVAWVGAGDGGDANNQTQPNFDPTVVASATVDQGVNSTGDVIQFDITSLVQDWVEGTFPNHGIMLRDVTSDGSFRGVRFGTKEGFLFNIPGAVDGPRLILTFVTEVVIDIKPGSDPNAVNPRSRGVIPVAILTTAEADGEPLDFDATTVDPLSVEFGPDGATEAHGRGHIEDVDGDGDLDLVLHFRTQKTGIECGDTEATLTGETFGGQAITGTDDIKTVGCKPNMSANKGLTNGSSIALEQNYPNPFNPETEIRFRLPAASHVVVRVFNTLGQEIRRLANRQYEAGFHSVRWDGKDQYGKDVASGLYFYQLQAGKISQIKKMNLLR